jgi:hypothetical protein
MALVSPRQQVKPDFSGEYILDRAASTLSPLGAQGVRTARLRILHAEPKFACEAKFTFQSGDAAEWAFELATDQPPKNGTDIRWDGNALVVRMKTPGPTITFRYRFEAKDRLRLEEQLRDTDHDQDNVWMFDRR